MTLSICGFTLVFLLYWTVPSRWKEVVLIAAGVIGLSWYSPSAALATTSLVIVVWVGLQRPKRPLDLVSVALVATAFLTYKLFANGGPFERPLILVGFAYAVPRAVHVLLDARYRGTQRPSLRVFLAYFWFFPTLAIGPIHRLDEFEREIRRRRLDIQQIGLGLERILVGLASVKLIADWLVSSRLDIILGNLVVTRDGAAAFGRSIQYGLNLYFQFAGWTAVAIGMAATLGIRVAENFHRPFAQPNLAAFWRSWHITLTRWTNSYVFQPVAAQTRRPFLAITATMFSIALWHEFSARYVCWACWHAGGLLAHRMFRRLTNRFEWGARIPAPAVRLVSTSLTVSFVFLGFTITRVASIGDAFDEFQTIFTGRYL